MCSSASSTENETANETRTAADDAGAARPPASRFSLWDRAVARALVVALITLSGLPAHAGDEFQDANNTTFDSSSVQLDNSQAGQTTFSIATDRTTIEWQDLQQPSGNTLEFDFTDPNASSAVFNYIGAQHPSTLNGSVISNGTVGFVNPFGVFIGNDAIIDVGSLVAIGGSASRADFLAGENALLPLTGTVENNGVIRADQNVALLGRTVVNNGEIDVEDGRLLMVGGRYAVFDDWDRITEDLLAPKDFFGILATGRVENNGSLNAGAAAQLGGQVANYGEIEIADGALMMMAADAVYVSEFDNPVMIRLPHLDAQRASGGAGEGGAGYAIENHGRIDAGLGHVRLAASDPLGFGIRQGTGGSIAAKQIELEGGEVGRVHLSGTIDASDDRAQAVGGTIDVTGSIIALVDAEIDASGRAGGGEIQIGGEERGTGTLQRARAVVVDEDSEIHADATHDGDGGRVIVFAEDLTSVDGELSARGGAFGGDGGFVETSGLVRFAVSRTPDITAPSGRAGLWLIDPFDITIRSRTSATDPPTADQCAPQAVACLNDALRNILDPLFDDTGFDSIIRTTNPNNSSNGGVPVNIVDSELIVQALQVGTSVILSTEGFGLDRDVPGDLGNITLEDAILIDDSRVLPGSSAIFGLYAANNVVIQPGAEIGYGAAAPDVTNLALTVELRANDPSQVNTAANFTLDQLQGETQVNASISTGGGDFLASGAAVIIAAGADIDTNGGDVTIRTGSLDTNLNGTVVIRESSDPAIPTPGGVIEAAYDTRIDIDANVDTSNGSRQGGDVTMIASSIGLGINRSRGDPTQLIAGNLTVTGNIVTGGGDASLFGGTQPTTDRSFNLGNVEITGDIDTTHGNPASTGGAVTLLANRVDPGADNDNIDITILQRTTPGPDEPSAEGGDITLGGTAGGSLTTSGGNLQIGISRTRNITIDADLDTQRSPSPNAPENGLIQIVAPDDASSTNDSVSYGEGTITIGENADVAIRSAGITLNSRTLTFNDAAGANTLEIVAAGDSSDPQGLSADDAIAGPEEIFITGSKQITFNENTTIRGRSIEITAAENPDFNDTEGFPPGSTPGVDEPTGDPADEPLRLTFGGSNASADGAGGVLLQGDSISILIGDGPDGYTRPVGNYGGLYLEDFAGTNRPQEIEIQQDAALTITRDPLDAMSPPDGQIYLAGAVRGREVGADGMEITIQASDGLLTIEDATGLNNGPTADPMSDDDDGKSSVILRGDRSDVSPDDGLGSGIELAIAASGGTPFDVESLTISSSGNYTIDAAVLGDIASANELVFEAGRLGGVSGIGTLSVVAGLTLQGGERLALLAGASGYGNLEFAPGTTTLQADEIDLRAGAGSSSLNSDASTRSRITGLLGNLEFRDANGDDFGDAASSATAFSYQQDAGINGSTDLPTLSQFADAGDIDFDRTGAGDPPDLEYSVRSDQGQIGLASLAPFANTALSLVGLQDGDLRALTVSDGVAFTGRQITLGGVTGFTFDQTYAALFNRDATDAENSITLRAGLGGSGRLNFDRGNQSSVVVRAPTVRLVVGDGPGGGSGSSVEKRNAEFDLRNDVDPTTRTFLQQVDGTFAVSNLPNPEDFIGGLPTILGIRSDSGLLDLDNFSLSDLPINLASDVTRVILEADSLTVSRRDDQNLVLLRGEVDGDPTTVVNPNLRLRLRADTLTLGSARNNLNSPGSATFILGATPDNLLTGTDADFDDKTLLIEAFDDDSEFATLGNLSELAADDTMPGMFDISEDNGQGPTTITLVSAGNLVDTNLPPQSSVSGQLGRSNDPDEDDGEAIPTQLSIASLDGQASITPERVNGSDLTLSGIFLDADGADVNSIVIAPGNVDYDLGSIVATTENSILVEDGVQLIAQDRISLSAGLFINQTNRDVEQKLGQLRFAGSGASLLQAREIELVAGPSVVLTNRDSDNDGDRDLVPNDLLPSIDFSGLSAPPLNPPSIVLDDDDLTDSNEARFSVEQSATLNTTTGPLAPDPPNNPESAFLSRLFATVGTVVESIEITSTQGDLLIDDVPTIEGLTEKFVATANQADAALVIDVTGDPAILTQFDDEARLDSDDILIRSTTIGDVIDLASQTLQFVSGFVLRLPSESDDRFRLSSDPDVLERPSLTISQAANFADPDPNVRDEVRIPSPDQYYIRNGDDDPVVRASLENVQIALRQTAPNVALTFEDDLRNRVTNSNLILDSVGDVDIEFITRTPGYETTEEPLSKYSVLQLSSLEIIADYSLLLGRGTGTITIADFPLADRLSITTRGDQGFDGNVVLQETLATNGRNMTFTGDITQNATASAGLLVRTDGKVIFGGNIGAPTAELERLWVAFDSDTEGEDDTPNVEFGLRVDADGEDSDDTPIDEEPIPSDQIVAVENDILFVSYDFSDIETGDRTSELETAIASVDTLADAEALFADFDLVRETPATFATIGKASGDLTFSSNSGHILMSEGEKLSVGGTALLDSADATGIVTIGDVSAIDLVVEANEIGLVRRAPGVTRDATGETQQDSGPSIVANTIDFRNAAAAAVTPVTLGRNGRLPIFGIFDPFNPATNPDFLNRFSLFEIRSSGRQIGVGDFRFPTQRGALVAQVPLIRPTGASRSDLSGAFPPAVQPGPTPIIPEPRLILDPERLLELAVESRDTPNEVIHARLQGAAVIDDLELPQDSEMAFVTRTRLDARDAEEAIDLYSRLFGAEGERAPEVRKVLQTALDRYLETTRARRVVGFELRRFVKNRPSTLIDAYQTLEMLDDLFRLHRRLGLSPGEFRRIQKTWLRDIQPDGISLDELAEAIHPSRYVRGSDILDIFGR